MSYQAKNQDMSFKWTESSHTRTSSRPRIVHRRCDSVDHSSRKSTSDESKLSLDSYTHQTPLSSPLVNSKSRQIDLDEVTRHSQDYKFRLSSSSYFSSEVKSTKLDGPNYIRSFSDSIFYKYHTLDEENYQSFPRSMGCNDKDIAKADFIICSPPTKEDVDLKEVLTAHEMSDSPDSVTLYTNDSILSSGCIHEDFILPDSSTKLLERFDYKRKSPTLFSKTLHKLRQKF